MSSLVCGSNPSSPPSMSWNSPKHRVLLSRHDEQPWPCSRFEQPATPTPPAGDAATPVSTHATAATLLVLTGTSGAGRADALCLLERRPTVRTKSFVKVGKGRLAQRPRLTRSMPMPRGRLDTLDTRGAMGEIASACHSKCANTLRGHSSNASSRYQTPCRVGLMQMAYCTSAIGWSSPKPVLLSLHTLGHGWQRGQHTDEPSTPVVGTLETVACTWRFVCTFTVTMCCILDPIRPRMLQYRSRRSMCPSNGGNLAFVATSALPQL